MPEPTPFHTRTHALCHSLLYKEWAGYYAVRSYETSLEPEYHAFRQSTGLLDISPLFKIEVGGRDAAVFLSYVLSRDIGKLRQGRVTYACLCDGDGKVIDDGTVARLGDEHYRVTTASPSWHWFHRNSRGFDVTLDDVSATTGALAVQGPTSRAVLSGAVEGIDLQRLRYFRIAAGKIAGVDVQVSRTGYTGDLGYEVWVDAERALPVWDAIVGAGQDHGLRPAGLDALDMVRIEAGYILQDVDYYSALRASIAARKSTPDEIGLDWTVDLEREPFIGQAAIQKERQRGPAWDLVGLEISWEELEALYDVHRLPPQLPAHAWRDPLPVYAGRKQVGRATSGTWSPILKKNLALASVRASHGEVGNELQIEHTVEFSRQKVTATVVERPFFDPERKRN